MNSQLSRVIEILEMGQRRNRIALVGMGTFCIALGLVAFFFLDPTELGRKAYFGRFLLPPLGVVLLVLPFVRKSKVLGVLRNEPQRVAQWTIQPVGQGLPLVLHLDDGATVSQDLNVHVAAELKKLLPQALPQTAGGKG